MGTACSVERRAFLKVLTTTTATLAIGGCGGASAPASTSSSPVANLPPVWQMLPTITFTQGVATSVSIASYVSDPNGYALTIAKNNVPLPAGVTYDQANKRFFYDGVGAVGSTGGQVLTANNGQP